MQQQRIWGCQSPRQKLEALVVCSEGAKTMEEIQLLLEMLPKTGGRR